MEIRNMKTSELITELMMREETRSMDIKQGEGYKVIASKSNGEMERYLRGNGIVKILEIKI